MSNEEEGTESANGHLGLGLLLLLGLTSLGPFITLRLDVLVIDIKGFVDLGLEGDIILNPRNCISLLKWHVSMEAFVAWVLTS